MTRKLLHLHVGLELVHDFVEFGSWCVNCVHDIQNLDQKKYVVDDSDDDTRSSDDLSRDIFFVDTVERRIEERPNHNVQNYQVLVLVVNVVVQQIFDAFAFFARQVLE